MSHSVHVNGKFFLQQFNTVLQILVPPGSSTVALSLDRNGSAFCRKLLDSPWTQMEAQPQNFDAGSFPPYIL